MRALAPNCAALTCLVMFAIMSPPALMAGGVGVSDPPDSVATDTTLSTSGSAVITDVPFHLYKARPDRAPRGHRDFDFLWSDTYKSRFDKPLDAPSGPEQINDLQRLAETGAEIVSNPFGLPWTDLQLTYNILAMQAAYRGAEYNPANEAPIGYKVAQASYPDVERNHLDAYIYARSFPAFGQWAAYLGDGTVGPEPRKNYGVFPSEFQSPAEDSLTGNAGAPMSENAIMLPGPLPSQVAATDASRWTRPSGTANAYLAHEGLHAINHDWSGSASYLHMFASGAEVVTGVSTDAPRYDVDYHYSLSPTADTEGNAYPHWQSFMAYLAFNWRGTDTTAGGWQDDLLPRWATKPSAERTLMGLARRLRDAECGECGSYPSFSGLDSLARVQRLIHDWRIASYVNNASLAGGRYGFPPRFGFSPAVQLGAWQNIDGSAADDSVAIPPVVTVGLSPLARSQWFKQRPAGTGFGPSALDMTMFGAEYFVFKADPGLSATPRGLVVRVRPGLLLKRSVSAGANCVPEGPLDNSGRLYASIVTYSQADDSLFRHPEWATSVVTQSALLDSVRGDLEFVVPGFGGTTEAVVLVVSLGDGPSGAYSGTNEYRNAPLLRWELGVALDDGSTPVVARAIASTTLEEAGAVWSPDGVQLAYSRLEANGTSRIYLRASDGSGVASPLRSATKTQADPAWSPRGDRIAYAEGDTAKIWFVNVANGAAQLGFDMPGYISEPTFAPDGGRLAYLREWVTTPGDTTPQDPPREGDLGNAQVESQYEEVRVRDLTSGADTMLVRFFHAVVGSPRQLSRLRWSSDARLLTFSRFDPDSSRFRLQQIDLCSRAITAHDAQAPAARMRELPPGSGPLIVEEVVSVPFILHCLPTAWECLCNRAPLSEIVAFASADRIAVHDTLAQTSTPFGYRTGAVFSNPRWSPDGTRVAYTTTQNGNPDVYVIATTLDRAPILSSLVLPSYTATGCNPFELSLAASDPDGDPVTFRVSGLPSGASLQNGFRIYWPTPVVGQHWFVVQALDPTGAVATRVIQLSVYDGGDCGGGGGGEGEGEILPGGGHAAREAGSSRVIGSAQSAPRAVNSFLDGAAPGQWVEQTARLVAARTDESGQVTAQLVGLRAGEFRLDRARLLVVDHDPALVPVATDSGVALGVRCRPTSVEVSGGSGAVEGLVAAGSVLTVAWSGADSLAGLLLDCARVGAVDSLADWGVRVEVRDGEGWRAHRRLRPRSGQDVLAVPLQGAGQARLVFLSDTFVRELTGYSLAGTQEGNSVRLKCSAASLDGAVANLAEADGAAVTLGRGQRVTLAFDMPSVAQSLRRSLFMELVASFTPADPAAAAARAGGSEPPGRFALYAGVPNPFERATDIRFEVARASRVRVEVFDAQGRRVRMLTDRAFAPGVHVLAWDGSATGGRRLGPGVYLVRMTAGDFRSERRVVRLGR